MKKIILLTFAGIMPMLTTGFASGNPPESFDQLIAEGRRGGVSPQYFQVMYPRNPAFIDDQDETENIQPDDKHRPHTTRGSTFYYRESSNRE